MSTFSPPVAGRGRRQDLQAGGRRLRGRLLAAGPTALVYAVLGLIIVLPLVALIYASVVDAPPRAGLGAGTFTWDNYGGLFAEGVGTATRNTLILAAGGTLGSVALGATTAWLAARADIPMRPVVQLAGILPLFIPALVGALAWARLGSPEQGYVNLVFEALGLPITLNIYSLGGMIFVFSLYYAPFVFLYVHGALSLMNAEFEEAAAVHGGSRLKILRHVTLPLVAPALGAGALLCFMLIGENFPTPEVLGSFGGIEALPSLIFEYMAAAPSDPNGAAALGVALVAFMLFPLYLHRRITGRRDYTTVSGKSQAPRYVQLGRWRWVGLGFAVTYLGCAIVLPLLALLEGAFRGQAYVSDVGALFDLSKVGVADFIQTLQYDPFATGLRNSLVIALGVVTIGGTLHFTSAMLGRRAGAPGGRGLEYLSMVPVALPALVMGMGFLWAWSPLPFIYGSLLALVLAYSARFAPEAYQGIATTLVGIDRDLEDSARVAGANRRQVAARIVVPLIRTGVASTLLLLVTLSFRELSVALFITTSDTQPLSLVIFDQWESGSWPRLASMSLVYILIMFVLALLARRSFRPASAG